MKLPYQLDLDVEMFKKQREFLGELICSGIDLDLFSDEEIALLEGLQALTDFIADQGHDTHGLDTLLTDERGE